MPLSQNAVAAHLPQREGASRDGAVGDDDTRGSDPRAYSGRLVVRQLLVAGDLLHQRSAGARLQPDRLAMLKRYEERWYTRRSTIVGLILLIVFVSALQLLLDLGKEHDWFASTQILCAGRSSQGSGLQHS
jgi:hypothetical protein